MEKRINRARSESAKVVLRDHDTALRVVLAEHGNLTKVAELHEVIKKEFSVPKVTPKNSLRLSSMHGAKGLEHHHVIFYGTNQVPHPNAEKEWELSAERNLKYVGLTRSKETLDLIESNEE
jgi:superfamily I DNA/RNA helicase